MIGMIGPSLGFQVESWETVHPTLPIPSFPEAKASLKPAQGDHPGWFFSWFPWVITPLRTLRIYHQSTESTGLLGTSQLNQVLCTKVQDLCLQHFIKCSV